jgi:hypothetical protein
MQRHAFRADAAALLAAGIVLCAPATALGQARRFVWEADRATAVLRAEPESLRLQLPSGWIRVESFRLARGDTLLTRGVDYLLDPRRGTVRLLRAFPRGTELHADYRRFPLPVLPEYARRPVVRAGEASSGSASTGSAPAGVPPDENAVRLDIRGSKTFAVEVGTRRDLALRQSLDLTVDGRLGRDTRVRAVLTDRRTPLEADGTSSRLGDLDRVRVEVEGPMAKMVLGDLRFAAPPSEFLRFDRRLQGAQAEATPGRFSAFVLGATAPGTYLTREFLGQEGKQGPYALAPPDTAGSVGGVVPGSERVWLDGAALRRGESEDYLIDYAGGTLAFTGKHPVTAYSEITVEYQVALDRYRRSVYGGGGEWSLGPAGGPTRSRPGASGNGSGSGLSSDGSGNAAGGSFEEPVMPFGSRLKAGRVRVAMIREGDDSSRPLFPLTGGQRDALRAAGDAVTAEISSGVSFVGPGEGEYDRVRNDTLAVSFFLWTGPGRGSYLVRFDEVGDGKGDYRDTTDAGGDTLFVYTGKQRGAFLPGTEVPRPRTTTLVSLAAAPRLGDRFRLRGEAAVSEFDSNTLSTRDDGDNRGAAWLLDAGAGPFPAGPVALSLRSILRATEARFRPFDRLDPAFFARDWNIATARLATGDRRRLAEATISTGNGTMTVTGEDLDNLHDYHGERGTLSTGVRFGGLRGDARVVRVRTRDRGAAGTSRGAREADRASLGWSGGILSASARYARERSEQGAASARTGAFFREGSVRLGTGSGFEALRTSAEFTRRVSFSLLGAVTNELDTGDTGQLEAQWTGTGGRLLAADLAARELRVRGGARQSSRVGRVRWSERAAGDALLQEGRWELTTTTRGGSDKEVRFIGAGAGRYDSLGTYAGVGDYEVFYRDRGDSAQVNRMDFSLRHEYDPGRSALSGETSAAMGDWARFRRGLRLVHVWTAGIETKRSAAWFWPRLLPVLAGEREVPFAEVRMTSEGSAFPEARWISPRLRWDRRRSQRALLLNATESGNESTWALRIRSRPGDRVTVDTEGDFESAVQRTAIRRTADSGIDTGLDGWRSVRLRVEPQMRLRTSLSAGLEAWGRRRNRAGAHETARVAEATPYVVWTPRLRSRIELRVTRTTVDRQGGEGRSSQLLEIPGWNLRLVAAVRLREELDLSAWYRDRRPDRGIQDREGRMELRASF